MMFRAMTWSMVVACGLGVGVQSVCAQERTMVFATADSGPAVGSSGRIAKSSLEAYSKLLNLTADQKSAATALHEGYDSAYSQATKEFSSAMEEMRRTSEESGDHSVFMERMPKAREDLSKKTKALEKSFMSDLQALLNTDQQPSWGKVERQRRREVYLRPGAVSGEGVNLLDTVEGLKLADDTRAALAESIAGYETDLDRALLAKQKMLEEAPSADPAKGFDPEAFRERMEKSREAGMKVKEINQQYQRRIESSLPEEKKMTFSTAVRKATFPQVYRPSRITRHLDAASKFDDLTAAQKESLASLKSSYDRDAAVANDAWANEIEAAEKKGDDGGELAMPDGGRMRVRFGEEDNNSPLAKARKARRELDEKTRSRLDTVLGKEQKERLPKEPQNIEGGMQGQFIMDGNVRIGG